MKQERERFEVFQRTRACISGAFGMYPDDMQREIADALVDTAQRGCVVKELKDQGALRSTLKRAEELLMKRYLHPVQNADDVRYIDASFSILYTLNGKCSIFLFAVCTMVGVGIYIPTYR
jgi:hypothetical protein